MASLQTLTADAEKILAAFATALTARGVELPDRRYVAPGQINAWDGEQLVVNLQSIDQGQPGRPFGGTYIPAALNFTAQFAVSIVREIPALYGEGPLTTMVPTALELDDAGQGSLTDGAALILAATDIYAASIHGTAGQGLAVTGPGEGFEIGPCYPVGPEGGLAGHRLLVTISLA